MPTMLANTGGRARSRNKLLRCSSRLPVATIDGAEEAVLGARGGDLWPLPLRITCHTIERGGAQSVCMREEVQGMRVRTVHDSTEAGGLTGRRV